MNDKDWLKLLFQHMHWADGMVWRSVFEFDSAQDDSRIRELLFHTHFAQHGFLAMTLGEPPEYTRSDELENLPAIAEWGLKCHHT